MRRELDASPPLVEVALRLAVGLAVASTLAVALALLPFAHPLGDDFCNAVSARELGVLGSVRHEYLNWGGRWASHVVVVGFPALVDPTRAYPLGLAACLAATLLALRWLLGSVPPLRAEPRRAWTLSLVLLALHWAGMPAPGQTVYWFEGAAVYSLSLSLGLGVVAGLLRLPEASSPRRHLASAGLAVLALVSAAFHELFALLLGGVLATGAAVAFATRDPRRLAWLASAAAVGVGLASIALAPGNEVRQATLNPAGPDLLRALGAALSMWLRVLDAPTAGDPVGSHVPLGWVVDARLLAASVLFALYAPATPEWLRLRPGLWRVLAPVGTLVLLSGAFLAGGLALGRTLPLRAFDELHLVFLLGWFLTIFVWASEDGETVWATPALGALRVASAGILALGLLVSGNVKHGFRDLARGRAVAFDRAMQERHREARRVGPAGASELVVQPIEPWPSSYFRYDLGELAPATRACVSRYFALESLREGESE